MRNFIIYPFLFLSILMYSQEINFGKVTQEELEEKIHPIDSTADAAYLYKKRRTYFEYDPYKGFIVIDEYHERIKIYTKEGFDYATKKISYYDPESGSKERISDLKAYTFNLENGKINKQKVASKDIFEEKINKYRTLKKISFPSVKEGSVIELKYKRIIPYWEISSLIFQHNIPVNNLDYQVKIPEYFIFNKRFKGYYNVPMKENSITSSINFTTKERAGENSALPTKTTFSNNKINYLSSIFIFETQNIPAMKDNEPYSGHINNYRGGMDFELSGTHFPNSMYKNYSSTWEGVCKQIYKSSDFGEQLDKQGYFKDDITNLIQGANDDYSKIALIFTFVKQKVNWNGYYNYFVEKGVKRAYKDGSGNIAEINLMLTSMLRFAGLNANPVLVSTRSNGAPIFPTLNGFDYVITKVNFSDNTYILLDASEKNSFPNILPERCLNWNGRELLENATSTLVNLIPKNHSEEVHTIHLKLNDDLSADGMLRTSYSNHFALFYRDQYNNKKEEDHIASLENKYNVEINDFNISNKNDLSKNVVQSFKFTTSDLIEEINGKVYITPLLFLAKKENPFKANERNFPIDFTLPLEQKHSVSIAIPEGYTIESVPENLAIGLPENLGVFKYQVSHDGSKIRVVAQFQINTHIISPEYYTTLKDFYRQLVAKQTEKIVIIKS